MRPSAAILIAVSVARNCSPPSGSCGQTLCASSITTSSGRRSARRSHSRERTAWATSVFSIGVPSVPMSTTRQRQSSPVEILEHRACLLPGPDAEAVDAEVAHPPDQPVETLARGGRVARGERLEGRRAGPFVEGAEQLVVLVRVADRVELQDGGVGGAVELREAEPEPVVARCGGRADEDRRRQLGEPRGTGRIGVGPRFAEADEVGVRIDHDHAQLGLEQELLEHDAERVRLARAGLSAEERVPVEAGRVDPRRHRVVTAREHGADHELGGVASRPGQLRDLEAGRVLDLRIDERSAVAGEHDARSLDDPHLHPCLESQRPLARRGSRRRARLRPPGRRASRAPG